MSSLSSMISKFAPLGAYRITPQSNVYKELCAYAVGLDMLCTELDTMLRECFFATAETYGLERAERLWGATRQDLPLSKRREMLLTRSAFGYDDFTPEGIRKLLKFLGISGVVSEYPQLQRIVVDLSEEDLSDGKRAWVTSQINDLFPAHLEVDLVFSGLDWADMDSLGLTFDAMEAKGLNWSEIDILR